MNTATNIERLAVTEKEAREMLGGISSTTMWRLRKQELIRPVPGLKILYSIAELNAFVQGRAVKGAKS
jgi:hypothetical protein